MRLWALAPLAAFAVLVALFGRQLFAGRPPAELPSALIDLPAPDFDLPPLIDDRPGAKRADLAGKPAIVNFFASWCVPCRAEHPVWTRLAAAGGAPIIGIAYEDKPEAARKFLAEAGDPYTRVGQDATGRTGIDFGIYGVPETFLIDGSGRIRYRFPGPVTSDSLEREILPRLRQLQAAS